VLDAAVLDDKALPVAHECLELAERLGGQPEWAPDVDLPAQQVGQAKGVEGIALHGGGPIALTSSGGDLGVHGMHGMTPGHEMLDEQALPTLDGDPGLARCPEGRQRRPELRRPLLVMRDAQLEQPPPRGIEGVDLVTLLAPIEPDEDVHVRALQPTCSPRRRRSPPGTLIDRCSQHISLGPVGARHPGGGAGLSLDL
jgi:hypothetical protein